MEEVLLANWGWWKPNRTIRGMTTWSCHLIKNDAPVSTVTWTKDNSC